MDADRWERKRERWEQRWQDRMERRRNHWSSPNKHLFSGFVFLAIGLIFLFGNMGFLNVGAVVRFWPVLLIAGGVFKLVESRDDYRTGAGVFWIVVGFLFLMGSLDIWRIAMRDFWPVVLIGVGSLMLWRYVMASHERDNSTSDQPRDTPREATRDAAREDRREEPPASSNSVLSATAILGGIQRRNNSQDFRGGDVTAIMGGCEIDLRTANITPPHEAGIEVFAMWGGIVIRVPPDWTVLGRVAPILGGFADKTTPPKEETKRLVVRGSAVMGGIEVRN